ncbi:DUF4234 domain-containing protein [Natronobacterium texcoconense]|uniref:DUF4234 domain-containing protein n=1 Tax=Natronobacterium texcoconense TaxID=1095778 RepID=A0A1H1J135_NATTX|nr:DUF4234 domain-containing protein [Natronobacterium texcoconense]SDR43613.1 protein of unknown function [Natronobacterium texcoconense]
MSATQGTFEERSTVLAIVLSIVTLGLYLVYWLHQVHKQFAAAKDEEFNPIVRTIGLFIPIYNLLVMWRTSSDAEELLPNVSSVVVFLTWIVFFPIMMYLVQSGINEQA